MLRLLLCSTILVFDVSTAHACDTVETATLESTCVAMRRDTVQGVWFDVATADMLRKAKLKVPELELQNAELVSKMEVREFQLKAYREVVVLKQSSVDTAMASMEAFVRTAREAREDEQEARAELGAWYRAPSLWAGIGAGVVTAIVVALR